MSIEKYKVDLETGEYRWELVYTDTTPGKCIKGKIAIFSGDVARINIVDMRDGLPWNPPVSEVKEIIADFEKNYMNSFNEYKKSINNKGVYKP